MISNSKSNNFLSFTRRFLLWNTALCIAISCFVPRNALRAADLEVVNLQSFAQEDSLFKLAYPLPEPSEFFRESRKEVKEYANRLKGEVERENGEEGEAANIYNRWNWFYAQRAYPNQDIDYNAWWNSVQQKIESRHNRPALDENWTSIGPNNMAGRTLAIAWHPTDSTIIYVGAADGGLWKTVNSGASWTPLTDDLASLAVSTIAIDPTNPNIIYIGTGEGSFNIDAVFGAGIFKSVDGGATWNTTGVSWNVSQSRAVNKIVIDPNNTQILYAAMNSSAGGVWKSINGGTSWTAYHSGDVKELYMAPDSSSVLYCCNGYPWGNANNGVWKSVNSGVTWTSVSTGLPSGSTMGRSSLTICQSNPQVLYLGVSQTISAGSALLGIYKTANGGASWTLQSNSPNFYNAQGWYDNVIAVDPTNSSVVYSSGLDLYKSVDNGVNWTRLTVWSYPVGHSQYAHADHHAFAFNPLNHNTVLCGTDGGVYRSYNNGTSWAGINSGLMTLQFYAMGNDFLNSNICYAGTQDNGTNKYNNSSTWTASLGGDGGYANVDYTNSNIVYAETQRGSHYRSSNAGSSYSGINSGLSGYGPWVTPVAMDPVNPLVLYTTASQMVYKTINSGTAWSAISTAFSSADISTIAIANSAPSTIYCGLASGGQVRKTTDGVNWSNVSTGMPNRAITRIAVDPTDANIAYATVSGYGTGHVYKTINGGTSWSNSSTGLLDAPCNVIVIDPNNTSYLYVGTDLGVYYSADAGANWVDYSTGLPNVVVADLALHPSTGTLRAATHGRGMWATPTTAPGIAVLYPNGGESLLIGTNYNITWSTGGIGGNVNVEVNTNYPAGSWTTLASNTSNDGNLVWTPTGSASNAVRIRVTSTTNPAQTDISNSNFSMAQPTITLLSPNGGETWAVGSSQSVSWSATGAPATIAVELNRSYPNSGTWEFLGTSNTSSFAWTVAGATSATARFRVYNLTNSSMADTSAANFTINNPTITVTLPNGGETLTPASFYTIRWTTQDLTGSVKVELNTNYPAGSWTILNAAVNADSLVWNVPATGTASARIRVTSNVQTAINDVSNANFTILTPTLAVTSPNGGESWTVGGDQTIRWNRANFSGSVNVYVNYAYSGGAWNLIGLNMTDDSLVWNVTNNPTATARVRVTSVNLSTYYDESNANFTISSGASSITVTAPNGGETWTTGTSQTISWTRSNAAGAATVEVNYNYPAGAWTVLTTTPVGNSYSWTVSGSPTATARIRVSLTANSSVNDISNANFTIANPVQTITVSSPNGGETWTTGTSQTITWTRSNASGAATVEVNYNYPAGAWITLTTTPAGNSFVWTVSGTPSANCRARVFLTATPSVGDSSNANFTIADPVQIITVSTPNGGESWTTGTTQTISWTRTNASGAATVEVNRSYPSGAWETLTTTPAGNSYNWSVSGTPSATCRVRVFLTATPSVSDTSNANFTIIDPVPLITLSAPNGGESWGIGTSQTITFTRSNASGAVTLEVNRNYPSGAWELITNTPVGNSFAWTVTGPTSANARVRVFLNSNSSVRDSSNANFSIANPSMTLTFPNGGESWTIGSPITISFTRTNASGNATIELNRNYPGGSWETLATTVSTNSFNWTVAGTGSNTCRMRVFLTSNSSIGDSSNANFTIVAPVVTLTSPNGGEIWNQSSVQTIRWTRFNASGNMTVALNRNYPAGAWENLSTTVAVDTFNWTVSGASSNTCRVKVFLTSNTSVGDTSAADFSIVNPTITVLAPNGGEAWIIGQPYTISWLRSNAAGNVTVQLNRNYNVGAWETLAANVSVDSFQWTASGATSNNTRVRVFLNSNNAVRDSSDANFALVIPSITVSSPNGGENWQVGSSMTISWTRNYANGNATVALNRNYPSGAWENLSAAQSGSSMSWTVTSPVTALARVRVRLNSDTTITDVSNANFSIIQPSLTLSYPNGGEQITLGSTLPIRWSRVNAAGNVTVELNRSYPSANWESLSTTVNIDSLLWNSGGAASATARVRIYLTANPTVGDTSNANFSLVQKTLLLTSHNSGGIFYTGSSSSVTLARTNATGNVTIQLNRSYPSASWENLTVSESTNSYTWNISGAISNTARLRVFLTAESFIGDTSDLNFSIANPSITLSSPNGGEVWPIDSVRAITWTKVGSSSNVLIELKRLYPAGSWETVANNISGNSYNWTTNGLPNTTHRIRVLLVSNSSIADTSNANFELDSTSLSLTNFNGGEQVPLHSLATIRWSRTLANGEIRCELDRNYPSGTWEYLGSILAEVNADSLNWTPGGAESANARVRVYLVSNPLLGDTSNANFSIVQPSLTILSPNGNDTLSTGTTATLRWSRGFGSSGAVRVELNRAYPAGAWETLSASVTVDSLNWLVTAPASSVARFRVSLVSNLNVNDISDANSTIIAPSVFLLNPAFGDSFAIGDTIPFQWQTIGIDPRVNIYIKRVYPAGTWESLAAGVQGGSWNWVANGAASNTARYRILNMINTSIGDTTDGPVPLGQPALVITGPSSAQTYRIGEQVNIQWTRSYAPGVVRVELSRGGTGGPWELLGNSSTNQLSWTASGNLSNSVRLRVTLQNLSWVSSMTGFNCALVQPTLTVSQPTSQGLYAVGRDIAVAWTRGNLPEQINVLLDRHLPTSTAEIIRSNISGDSIHWTINGEASDSAQIILQTASGLSFSAQSNLFRIGTPHIDIYEIGESAFLEGDTLAVRWQRHFVTDPVNVYVCRTYPNGGWNLIANSVSDSVYRWIVDNQGGNSVRFRVRSVIDPTLADSTEEDVELTPFSLAFSSPDSAARLPIGFSTSISWIRTGVAGNINLYLSRDGGLTFPEIVASSIGGNSYSWTPGGSPSNNAKLRIASAVTPSIADTSAPFILALPALQLTNLNSGELLLRDSTYQIYWSETDHPATVNLQLNRNYPSGVWETVATALDGNSYNWTPTGSLSDHCRLRIYSTVNSGWMDESDQDFNLSIPSLTIVSPTAGAELLIGDFISVNWQRTNFTGLVNLLFRRDSGSWEMLATNLSTNVYSFTLSGISAATSEFKVESVLNPLLSNTVSVLGPYQQRLYLLSPTDTTCWVHNTSFTFTWLRNHAEADLRLEINRNFPSNEWELIANHLQGEHYIWDNPQNLENGASFRLSLTDRETVADTANFGCVLYPELHILDMDTTLRIGQLQLISWGRDFCDGTVIVSLNRDYPDGLWEPLYSGTANNFTWPVSGALTDHGKLKIESVDHPEVTDISDFSLIIYEPSLAMTLSPLQEIYEYGNLLNISFTVAYETPFSTIAIQRDGGLWEPLFTNVTPGNYIWTVNGPLANAARIKVFAPSDNSLADTSEVFAIAETHRTLVFTTPLESGIDTAGTHLALGWSWSEGEGLVRLEVSHSGLSGEWSLIADSLADTSFSYEVEGPETDSLIFRVSSIEFSTVFAFSAARSVIVPSVTLQIGGETWYIGSQHWIRWTSNHYNGTVNLEVNRADRAEEWENLSSAVMDSFLWTVTGPEAENVALRISGAYGVSDTTDAPLNIRLPRVTVVAPNGGEHLIVDENIRLRWTAEGLDSPIAIGLWRGDPVNQFDTLFLSTENDSEEIWQITGPAASGCFLAVFYANNLALHDTSDGAFTIELADAADDPSLQLPKAFALSDVYPNPFNSTLHIRYALPVNSELELTLYNLLGQEVAVMRSGKELAGVHEIAWQADGIASGLYLLRMRTEKFTATQKIHYLK